MKKIISIIVVAVLFVTAILSLSVTADDPDFVVETVGDAVVSPGKTHTYKFSINDIKITDGILGADIWVNYDTEVFEFVEASSTQPSTWESQINSSVAGEVRFSSYEKEANLSNCIVGSGKIVFSLSLKVKDDATKDSKISFILAKCVDTAFDDQHIGSAEDFDITIMKVLSAPENPTLTEGLAKWDAVENADSYSVQLYKDGQEYRDPVSVTGTEYNFEPTLTEGGNYSFRVTAVSTKAEYEDSEESAHSTIYTKKGNLSTPAITIAPDYEKGGIKYQITDKNPDGTVSQYIIEVYEKGSDTPVNSGLATVDKAGNIAAGAEGITSGKEYTVTVTALAKDSNKYFDSTASAKSNSAKAAVKAKSVSIKTQPSLSYVEGNKLDLSGMIAVILFSDDSSVEVSYKNFSDYGLSASIDDEVILSISEHNGKKIAVKLGKEISVETDALTVKTSTCSHTTTSKEHLDPTCGKEGHDRVVCSSCNVIVSSTPIPATNQHTFSDWLVVVNPTPSFAGMQRRICSVCSKVEEENIPPLSSTGTTAADTETSDETTAETDATTTAKPNYNDDPDVSNGDGMNDLSKVFLIIVIVVFALILIFIVGAVWIENRKSRARRARRRNYRNRR